MELNRKRIWKTRSKRDDTPPKQNGGWSRLSSSSASPGVELLLQLLSTVPLEEEEGTLTLTLTHSLSLTLTLSPVRKEGKEEEEKHKPKHRNKKAKGYTDQPNQDQTERINREGCGQKNMRDQAVL